MDDMESKLSAILGDPQMMRQIMSMAQALGQSPPEPPGQDPPPQQETPKQAPPPKQSPPPRPVQPPVPAFGGTDMAMLQKLMSAARQSGIDKDQQNLLKALSPYLSRDRIIKLEKAMRAAKIAALASAALGSAGISFQSGR